MNEWNEGIRALDRQYDKLYIEAMRERIVELEAERDALKVERDAMREALERPLLPLSFYQEAALQSQKRAEKAEAERDKLKEVINQMRAIVENNRDFMEAR